MGLKGADLFALARGLYPYWTDGTVEEDMSCMFRAKSLLVELGMDAETARDVVQEAYPLLWRRLEREAGEQYEREFLWKVDEDVQAHGRMEADD